MIDPVRQTIVADRLGPSLASNQGSWGEFPPFIPSRWIRGGDAQTVLARYWGEPRSLLPSKAHEVIVADGDRLLVLESEPSDATAATPTALLVHGLAGSADAPYVVRMATRLLSLGVRVLRLNLRGSGDGFGLAKHIYHAGRSDDLRAVIDWFRTRNADAPVAAIGFSLGANLVLKLAIEAASEPVAGLDVVLAANPPLDLAACARRLSEPRNRLYDWNFVRWLRAMAVQLHHRFPELGPLDLRGVKTVYEFDDIYTAPRNGFGTAANYYARNSLHKSVCRIEVPGLIVHAKDDPFIPPEPFDGLELPARVTLELSPHGGHLGYLSHRPWGGDRRWLEARLQHWLRLHWQGRLA
jgi:predicted alpha/beta-fold hydrolase